MSEQKVYKSVEKKKVSVFHPQDRTNPAKYAFKTIFPTVISKNWVNISEFICLIKLIIHVKKGKLYDYTSWYRVRTI